MATGMRGASGEGNVPDGSSGYTPATDLAGGYPHGPCFTVAYAQDLCAPAAVQTEDLGNGGRGLADPMTKTLDVS